MSSYSKRQKPVSTKTTLAQSNYSPKKRLTISFPANSPYTKQEFKNECDINVLMSKYQNSGELPVLNQMAPQYLDVTGLEYQESMNFIAGAKSLFQEMPSSIRNRFENNPALFLDFCSAEKNRPEMAQMGLLKPETEWVQPLLSIQPTQNPTSQISNPKPDDKSPVA